MKKIDKLFLVAEQQRLDKINRSEKYSFKQMIDNNGDIHVDCDAETFIKEMGLIPLDKHIAHLNSIVDK